MSLRGGMGGAFFFRGMAGIMMRYFIFFRSFQGFLGWFLLFVCVGESGMSQSAGGGG